MIKIIIIVVAATTPPTTMLGVWGQCCLLWLFGSFVICRVLGLSWVGLGSGRFFGWGWVGSLVGWGFFNVLHCRRSNWPLEFHVVSWPSDTLLKFSVTQH